MISRLERTAADGGLPTIAAGFPVAPESVPSAPIEDGAYRLRFAATKADLSEVLRLRFRVFNLELGEGFTESFSTGEDRDEFDDFFHHILVEERSSGTLIGTYRIQTVEMARANRGFYSSSEYETDRLPEGVLQHSVEVGRACIAKEHRNRQVLFLLWQGLADYLLQNRKRYLFGCCSLTSQDERLAHAATGHLAKLGVMHPSIVLPAREGFACAPLPGDVDIDDIRVEIPVLFKTYLRHGARVLSAPAIDRRFKTIDFLVMLDVRDMARRSFDLYFGKRGDELP